ncbi:DNA cytosine methyltransferase [Achromobacter sp. UMC46]|uniref:DNA cytosine methyltransferase n=1 Tax=Achromobacter sp. UMC46 TaxID=1862319 RepID=UPI001600C61E|nr:DNA cytosine methyltransferase [Achromobacter sp. UMC46]MBB1593562.1 hypothetical protein [Achromobacter sp. UMC46]
MRFLSVCSGIEAASVAWNPLGWKAVAFSEIEPFPSAVLAHHYPDTPNWGDMTKYKEWPDVAIDLLCGGTPCQSFSVAGLRKGMDDPRGNLMLTFGAIAAKYRPKWLVWENVPGVLSSNAGQDFASFLGLITGQVVKVPASGWSNSGIVSGIHDAYGVAYRVLDAQYFGVPQRRRRVFVVGCLGDWRSAAAVLFERHGLSGNPAPSRKTRQGFAPTLSARAKGGGGLGTDFDCDGGLIAATLLGKPNSSHAADQDTYVAQAFGGNNTTGSIDVATALNACASASGRMDFESETFIAHSLRGEGFDASEDGTGRGTPLISVASREVAGALTSNYGKQPDSSDSALGPSLAIAFDCKSSGQNGFGVGIELAGTRRAMAHSASHTNSGGHQAVAYSTKLHNTQSNQAGKVYREYTAGLDRNSPPPALLTAMQVRRLTPEECEALQAYPRDYTRIPWRKKPASECPDGPRYKALGNSWCVTNVRWIGERIDRVNSILEPA